MEREYKYELTAAVWQSVYQALFEKKEYHTIKMDARYLDTPSRMLRSSFAALRLRKEVTDGKPETVACVKLPAAGDRFGGALRNREEYECAVDTLLPDFDVFDVPEAVLDALIAVGAPEKLLKAAAREGFTDIARVSYTRLERKVRAGENVCTVCMDKGFLGKHPFMELEIEHKRGDFAVTKQFAEQFASDFHLEAQPLSKLARALQ